MGSLRLEKRREKEKNEEGGEMQLQSERKDERIERYFGEGKGMRKKM